MKVVHATNTREITRSNTPIHQRTNHPFPLPNPFTIPAMTSVIIFGPTGQVGSAAARTAGGLGAKIWLAMRDPSKSIPSLTAESEAAGDFHRIQADLRNPPTVSQAIKTSGAKRAFIYLIHHEYEHLHDAIVAMKNEGVEFVVFLSSFTVYTNQALRAISPSDLLPFVHAQVEASLEELLGPENYVAVRPGCFATNLLSARDGIATNHVKLYGAEFEQDNIVPSDIGSVIGNIIVSGPKGQKIVYLYGPEVLSIRDSVARIGSVLNKDLKITTLSPEEGYKKYITRGMPPSFADYMVRTLGTKGPDKGNGERFPHYEEGVKNVALYTGRSPVRLEEWVRQNRAVFGA
ncbi:hypothetical protein J3E72DRAFT_391756 [Bipolaris maydis]|nr:hypothetical protein J3E74DRAFT_428433 [Bipolaris maydis]KAJ6202054.1 hypothetical protein J3E72DRAFT_391756 [Bipolaris maydis]KAJ6210944.1 hypothetical protein PSV09DRAFT_2187031 [Bipolaris maydis]